MTLTVFTVHVLPSGKECHEGQSVYSEQRSSEEEWNAVFPDGVPLGKDGDKKPPYVFVWKAWGKIPVLYFIIRFLTETLSFSNNHPKKHTHKHYV